MKAPGNQQIAAIAKRAAPLADFISKTRPDIRVIRFSDADLKMLCAFPAVARMYGFECYDNAISYRGLNCLAQTGTQLSDHAAN